MKEIPLFFTFNRIYVVPAAVAFHSLLKHANRNYAYSLYVLHTDLRESDERCLMKVVRRFENVSLSFINTSSIPITEEAKKGKKHFSKEIFYKLIAAEIFPQYDRIICSDVDVAFKGDVSQSYFMYENEFFYYAGVGPTFFSRRMEVYKNDFTPPEMLILEHEIDAGYLLINLKAIREHGMQEKLTQYYLDNYYRLKLPEQDCMILCCWPDVKPLPMEYMVSNGCYRINTNKVTFNSQNEALPKDRETLVKQFENILSHPKMIHYQGPFKPWNSFFCPKQKYWFSLLRETECVSRYISILPTYIVKRFQRYNLKRFIGKVCHKIRLLFN